MLFPAIMLVCFAFLRFLHCIFCLLLEKEKMLYIIQSSIFALIHVFEMFQAAASIKIPTHLYFSGCSFLAKTAVKIKEHCRTHTGERQLACPTCGGFFSNKTKFIDHLTRQNAKLCEFLLHHHVAHSSIHYCFILRSFSLLSCFVAVFDIWIRVLDSWIANQGIPFVVTPVVNA